MVPLHLRLAPHDALLAVGLEDCQTTDHRAGSAKTLCSLFRWPGWKRWAVELGSAVATCSESNKKFCWTELRLGRRPWLTSGLQHLGYHITFPAI